jgi:hypothetical protein
MIKRMLYLLAVAAIFPLWLASIIVIAYVMIIWAAFTFITTGKTEITNPDTILWMPNVLDKIFWNK